MHIDDHELIKPILRYTALRETAIRYSWCTAGAVALGGGVALGALCGALGRAGAATGPWVAILLPVLAWAVWRLASGVVVPDMVRLDMLTAHRELTEATRDALERRGLDLLPGWQPSDITRGRLKAVGANGRVVRVHVRCNGCKMGTAGHFPTNDQGGLAAL